VFRDLGSLNEWLVNNPNTTFVGANFKFDLLHLHANGIHINLDKWVGDTNLMAYVLSEKISDQWLAEYSAKKPKSVRPGSKHSLKTLAPYFLNVEPYWEALGHDSDEYVLKDAEYTLALHAVLEAKLKERGEYDFYKNKLLPWTKMLLTAEMNGLELDIEALNKKELALKEAGKELRRALDDVWAPAHQAYSQLKRDEITRRYEAMALKAGKTLNISPRYKSLLEAALAKAPNKLEYDSPKQMAWLLRDYHGYDITGLDGDETTGREVLERLADSGHTDVKTYLQLRKTSKLLTAFLPTLRELSETRSSKRATVHPIYNVTSTKTGRTSSERPNAQQVPPELRPLFKARDTYSIIGYDAAAIEARLIAAYTEDPTLYEIISSGVSLHDYNTVQFLGLECDPSEVKTQHPNERSGTKNVGFALFYNAGPNRIRIAYAQKGIHLSFSESKAIHERFKSAYSVAYDYSHSVVKHLESGGKVENLLGRPLIVENAEDAYMQGFNKLIQSSASDLNLHCAWLAWQAMLAKGIDATPVLFVHDYVGFEVADRDVPEANRIIKEQLTQFQLPTQHGTIRLEVEGGVSKCWEK
jgi:DNA polymerase I-like protein with 3'-5' exonuclease and polymerase domains